MVIADFFFAAFFSAAMALLLALVVEPHRPWRRVLWTFVLLFAGAWAAGVWLKPFGPPLGGSYWAPYLIVAVLLSIVLAATRHRRRTAH